MKKALFTMFIFTVAFVGISSLKASAMCYGTSYCNDLYNWYGNGSTWGTSYPTTWGTSYPVTWGTTYPTTWGSGYNNYNSYNSYGCSYNCYSYSQPYNYGSYSYPYYGGYASGYGYNGGMSINLGFTFIRR
ncbi:MAG: hypothetical protein U0469_02510 [Candidatus Paceibacterota bacterium]|jgi:hypothetical protein